MNEEKLVKLLKDHFPTKKEFLDITKHLDDLDGRVLSMKHSLYSLALDLHEFKKEVKEEFKNFDVINEKLDELRPLSKALDSILEKHPIERIKRLETHAHLSPFTPVSQEN